MRYKSKPAFPLYVFVGAVLTVFAGLAFLLTSPMVVLWRRPVQRLGFVSSLVALCNSLDAFLAVEKHLLVKQGIFRNVLVRGPVGFRLDEETRREVDRLFERINRAVDGN